MTAARAQPVILPEGRPPGAELREPRRSGEPFDRFVLSAWEDAFPGVVAGVTAVGERADFGLTTVPSAWELVGRWSELAGQLGFGAIAVVRQVHGARLRSVKGPVPDGVLVAGQADGLLVERGGALACVTAADCVPVYVLDPASGRMALLHAGWRGASAGVVEAGLGALEEAGAEPARLRVHLGPAICGDCYEVGREVLRAFGLAGANGAHLDLRHALASRALAFGVEERRITRSAWCTRCSSDHFHSHRGRGARAGRMAAYLGWKDLGGAREPPDG